MISCGDVEEFVPFGRIHLKKHPGNHVGLPIANPNIHLNRLEKEVQNETWSIRRSKDGLTDEELYINGCTVIWSRGEVGNERSRRIIKSITCETTVKQAIFTSFYTYPDLPCFINEPPPDEPTGEELPSICILENDCLNVYSEDGDDFFVKLPFPVSRIWSIKFGILLEHLITGSYQSNKLPIIYSLFHPLDEINPVTQGTNVSDYVRDPGSKVIFTCNDPSICVLHSTTTNSLTIWKIKRVKHEQENVQVPSKNPSLNTTFGLSESPSPHLSHGSFSPAHSPGHLIHSYNKSLFNTMSLTPKVSITQTPVRQGISTPSHTQSIFGYDHLRLGLSPSPARSPRNSNSFVERESRLGDPEPLIPDLTLDLLWTEKKYIPRPSKVFLSEDCVGQKFLCFLIPQSSSLCCSKYELTNDASSILFGIVASLPAKDATPIPRLKMMIVVDTSSCITLYSGITRVCRLHIAGLPTANTSLFKDFSSLNISHIPSPVNTPVRRSSLMTSSRPPSALDIKFEVGLSPVSTEKSFNDPSIIEDPSLPLSSAVLSLRDSTDLKVSLEHTSGNLYRVGLPVMHSSILVETCLAALRFILPRDTALHVIGKWYLRRNAPGNLDFSPQGEWSAFSLTLLSLIGYDTDKLAPTCPLDASGSLSPMISSKKFRVADSGSDSDWDYVLSSNFHQAAGGAITEALGLQPLGIVQTLNEPTNEIAFNASAVLFNHLPSILLALHLVYEEMKLNSLNWELCGYLVPTLAQLASDLQMKFYLHHYWRDFPMLCPLLGPSPQMKPEHRTKLSTPGYFTEKPPSILAHIQSVMREEEIKPFPYIPGVCAYTKKIVLLYCVAATDCPIDNIPMQKFLTRISPSGQKPSVITDCSLVPNCRGPMDPSIHQKIVMLTDQLNLSSDDIEHLAPGLSLLLMNSQHMCRSAPPQNWPASSYQLIQRSDLVAQRAQEAKYHKTLLHNHTFNVRARQIKDENIDLNVMNKKAEVVKEEVQDGMDALDWDLLKLRWPEDQRIQEVRKMLSSSSPSIINIVQRPEVNDHDLLEELERHLYALCIRTMALPMGRSMFTLCTHTALATESLSIPALDLTGKAPPRGNTIDLSNIEVPPNMNMWPLFHNGVAAGLRISPNCNAEQNISSSWIVYNKPKENGDLSTEHAGFLMALGLNGHLKSLAVISLHDYLSRGHEMTSVGLLLGSAAARRGTMDMQITKLLSCHLECLLPPTSSELDVPHTVQVAGIMGVGLLYQDTAHRHMSEVLLQEIGRPPGPEMENCTDRESYSLAAGLSLGLVMFGRGGESVGFADINIAGELYHYIEGGTRRPVAPFLKDKYKSPSYQIKEGERVNVDVTAPGATLALGMIYFNSNNSAIAEWMVAPNTPYLLDQVRPDFLLLRTISHGLIMWDSVKPSSKWVEAHVPSTIHTHVHRGGNQATPGIYYESMHQAYYNILAGACMVLGLKFAGSANNEAFHVLWKYTRMFVNFTTRSFAEIAGKSTIETCLNVTLLSLSMVMAGTGDLDILRIVRFLRSRIGPNNSTVGYGSHLAIHMSLGFLFLGGGRFSLSTSNMSIAALIIACFPKFPTHSNDNRYHLQALRHLYVLAIEPRLVIPVDVDTKKLRNAKVSVWFHNTDHYKGDSYTIMAPHMLPELSKISKVIIEGDLANDRYWPIRFCSDNSSWNLLEALLRGDEGIPMKLKDGRYPYNEAPSGHLVKMPHYLAKDKSAHWTISPSLLEEVFGSSALVQALVGDKKSGDGEESDVDKNEANLLQNLSTIIYEYMAIGKPQVITNWMIALQSIRKIGLLNQRASHLVWQIKLITIAAPFLYKLGSTPTPDSFIILPKYNSPKRYMSTTIYNLDPFQQMDTSHDDSISFEQPGNPKPIVSPEQALSLSKQLNKLIDSWQNDIKDEMFKYLKSEYNRQFSVKCALTLVLKDFPVMINSNELFEKKNSLEIINSLKKLELNRSAILAITKMLLYDQ